MRWRSRSRPTNCISGWRDEITHPIKMGLKAQLGWGCAATRAGGAVSVTRDSVVVQN